ncbi:Spc7 kinetochore protein-domain-containing protein [Lophiotrema nucula]|uniref:Spc7 kinetochore protein-domain-containing protein n=1 Tax=Lophiotrema nucula TaxID=690887 RepID=A0A6A5YSH5_9PLEO|nr:Spc7 kinetochore protein-domain-containing protein [Lophiotrema nucula]
MARDTGNDNIADGLIASASFQAPSLSPKKASRRMRSKSIGPGGLGDAAEPALKESSGNRRKSAFVPAVKSILSSNDEDEKKRREARRKSLARRRVSFAPEATLHTWDVVEYLRDATTSSASSEATRRASSVSQASSQPNLAPESDVEEPPSTPPEQVEEPETVIGSSPANQRDLHQKKRRRRSSGIPPMNFNNPDDVFSSSPLSGDNQSPGGGILAEASSDEEDHADPKDSPGANESSESSTRLDDALRQAAAHANTQQLDLAPSEIKASFKPWTSTAANQENMDPFSPKPPSAADEAEERDDNEDMSMDITRAIGKIVPQPSPESDDATMDLTMPLGSIQQAASRDTSNRRKSLKRRRSSVLEASRGSPAKRPAARRTSMRSRPHADEVLGSDDATMDFTVAIGAIKSSASREEQPRRSSVDSSIEDETMDFTVAVGSITDVGAAPTAHLQEGHHEEDEDLSMEFTNVIGGIKRINSSITTPEKPANVLDETPTKLEGPTPSKSPRKSPARSRLSIANTVQPIASPHKSVFETPRKSPGRPRRSLVATPEARQSLQRQDDTRPAESVAAVTTPTNQLQHVMSREIPDDPVAAPILNRRRSSLSNVQFSPLAIAREEPVVKSAALLTNNIKLLSTPRKQMLASPMKRGLTPKKSHTPVKDPSPKQKTPTPKKVTPRKSVSPRKRVAFGEEPHMEVGASEEPRETDEEVERISLQDFLDMTKIRFMDLSTTKRRHTAAPTAFHDKEIEEGEDSLGRYVVAGACSLPEYELYQHACHEMKKYISDGRHFVRTMEANVMDENPLLFSEYLTAPPDQRTIMDNQFKNLKTNARLDARGEWYGWRSTLLHDLKGALLGTMEGFKKDEKVLASQETLLDKVLPSLSEQQERLDTQCKQLQQRHDELHSCDMEELESAREQLAATDAELAEKRESLAQMKAELADQEARIESSRERKIVCVEEIRTAERVREECRGWSTQEVNELKGKVTALEQAHGWSITSATSTTVTMTHMNDLELYFQPSAFATGSNTANGSISLTYVGDSASPHPRPLTTSKRFFLQMIRAYLHCIPQSQTRIAELLTLVKSAWSTALAVAEGVRWLECNFITDEFILSDERMAISTNMLLPALQTKVRVTFELGVNISSDGVDAQVEAKADLVYGEKYSEDKMAAFLRDFCGNQVKEAKDMAIWADAVLDLAGRLRTTGRKGERAH